MGKEKREKRGIRKTEGRGALWALDENVPSETSVTNYQSMLRNIPEERGSDLHRGGNLKTRNVFCINNICVGLLRGFITEGIALP